MPAGTAVVRVGTRISTGEIAAIGQPRTAGACRARPVVAPLSCRADIPAAPAVAGILQEADTGPAAAGLSPV